MKSMEQKKIKAVNYCRVSTDNEDQLLSYEMQKKYQDENYDIVKIFDDQESGKTIKDRKGFNEMLEYLGIKISYIEDDYIFKIIEQTDIKVILVASTSRFARNNIDAQRLLKVLHKQGLRVYFQDLKEFSDNDNIDFMLKLYFQFDERYSRDISKKVKVGMERRKKEGYILASNRLIGFNFINGRLEASEEAIKVKAMFEDYVYNNVATRGLAKKYGYSLSTITTLLKNPKYAGLMAYGVKENKYDYDKLDIHKSELITPIVSEELFWKAQEIRKSRSRFYDKDGKQVFVGNNSNTRGLSSKIVCPACGKKYNYKNRGYFVCSTYSKKGKCTNKHTLREQWVIDWLKSEYGLASIRNGLEVRLEVELSKLELEDLTPMRKELEGYRNQSNKLVQLLLNEKIDEDTFDINNMEIKSKIEEIERHLKSVENKEEYKNKLEDLSFSAKSILDKYESILDSEAPEDIFLEIESLTVKIVVDLLTGKTRAMPDKVTFKEFKILEEYNLFSQYYNPEIDEEQL